MINRKLILNSSIILILCCFVHFSVFQCHAQDRMNGPFKYKTTNNIKNYGEGRNIFFNFYQKWLSPVKGGNKCPMYPSCSQYAKNAFHVLPWHEAYIKILERLLRCGNELHLYRKVRINGTIRWYDPVITKELKCEFKIIADN